VTTPSTDFTKLPKFSIYVVKVHTGGARGDEGNWQNMGATFDPELASLLKAQLEREAWTMVFIETVDLFAQSVEVLPREVKVTLVEASGEEDDER
jgi:hypothetical protein